ncbi:Alpha/Beta hydrolase protein [Dipodascopsis uninucleata]
MYTVNYGEDSDEQCIDIYPSKTEKVNESKAWLVYVHGGAWIDPHQNRKMGKFLCSRVPSDWSAASVDYRLSPKYQHPTHYFDVLEALNYMNKHYGLGDNGSRVVLVGHSAGACIALQVLRFMFRSKTMDGNAPLGAGISNDVIISLCDSISDVVGVEGIYDLEGLVAEYPDYRSFVTLAFGSDESNWREPSPYSWPWCKYVRFEKVKYHFIQSYEDQLLSSKQTLGITKQLKLGGIQPRTEFIHGGSHDDTVSSDQLAMVMNSLY